MLPDSTPQTFQFPLRWVFVLLLCCAVIFTVPHWLRVAYYWDRDAVESRLNALESISNVVIHGHDDVTYEVGGVSFSLQDRPDTQITISLSTAESLRETEHLHLCSIGPWQFHAHGHGDVGVVDQNTGLPVISEFFAASIDIGRTGRFGHLMPCEITSVEDVIANYDLLVDFFEDWPDESAPGLLLPDKNTRLHYYKVPGSTPVQ